MLGREDALAGATLAGWRLLMTPSLEQARLFLTRGQISVVLCDPAFAGMDWKRALRLLAGTSSRPSILLLAPPGRRFSWNEVAAAGGYDVVVRPIDVGALERVMRSARAYWLSRRALESTPANPLRI